MDITVLAPIDPNILHLGNQSGKGAWKRRARLTGKKVGTAQVESEGLASDRANISGKRRFTLRVEDDNGKENSLCKKKLKIGDPIEITGTQMVEVASHEWPQIDQ